MIKIPKISPIRFYKDSATDFENAGFQSYTGETYAQEFKQSARTVVYREAEELILIDEETCRTSNVVTLFADALNLKIGQKIQFKAKGKGSIILTDADLDPIETIVIDEADYINLEFDILTDGGYRISLAIAGGDTICIDDMIVTAEPFFYSICGNEYTAVNLGLTPYKDDDGNDLYAFELNTAQHSTDDGYYVIEVGEYVSEPLYINNASKKKQISYKTHGWNFGAFKNYVYFVWLDSKIDYVPKNETEIAELQSANVVLDTFFQFARKFTVKELLPYYFAELFELIFNFDEITIEQNPYTKIEEIDAELLQATTNFYNCGITLRKPYDFEDFGNNEFFCRPARVFDSATGNLILTASSGQDYFIAGSGVCDEATITLNGSAFLTIPSGGSENIILQDQSSNPITPDSVVGSTVTVNVPRDVFIKGLFAAGNDQMEQFTVDADSAGTYTTITDDGSSGTISLEVNGSPATLPFTLAIGDTLDAERSTFTASGFFKIIGTY
jgi:hypothetical protein